MISRYEAWLNGVSLSSISSKILILDIQYPSATIKNETFLAAKRHGARLHRRYIDKASVTIVFEIREYSLTARQSVCADIVRWAKNGGVLKTIDRPGQRLRCVCDKHPSIQSAMKWTDALSITFSAYALPFWEEETPVELTLSGQESEGNLFVPGNVDEAFVEIEAIIGSHTENIAFGTNNRRIELYGITAEEGQTITLTYDDEMIQSIKIDGVSLLGHRSQADDLIAFCGQTNKVGFSSWGTADVTFKVRGLWL